MSAQGTYRFYSVSRQKILLVNGEPPGRERVNNVKNPIKKISQLTLSIPNDSIGLSVTSSTSIFAFLDSREVYYRKTKTVLMWGLMARWLQLANHGSWLAMVKIPGCFSGIQPPHCTSLLLISNTNYSF